MEAYLRKSRTRNEKRRRKLLEQRLMGVAMLIVSALFLWMVWGTGEDAGALLVIVPLGLLLLFSKEIMIV
jgi:hypothetical protein